MTFPKVKRVQFSFLPTTEKSRQKMYVYYGLNKSSIFNLSVILHPENTVRELCRNTSVWCHFMDIPSGVQMLLQKSMAFSCKSYIMAEDPVEIFQCLYSARYLCLGI